MSALATLAFLVPILAAVLLALAGSRVGRAPAATAAVAGALASAALLAFLLAHAGVGPRVVWLGGWRPERGVAYGIALGPDRLGLGVALFCAVLTAIASVLAGRLIRSEAPRYHAVVLLFLAAMVAFSTTADLFDLFVFFELMSVSAYVLVGYEVRRRTALEGSLTFAVTNTVGSILMLFGICVLYARTGALDLAQLGRTLATIGAQPTGAIGLGLIAAGFLVKAAAVPFHFWVADAYAVAPTPVCLLLAGVFSELGLFGLARVWWTAFAPAYGDHADALRLILVVIGVLSGLIGGMMALLQHHLKRMLAFVVVAQIGVMLVGIGLLRADALAGVALFLVADGLLKAALFTLVALLQHRYDSVDVRRLHGRARELPVVAALFGLAALGVAGLPFLGPASGRALIDAAALATPGYRWLPVVLTLVAALSAAPVLRAGLRVFVGLGRPAPRDLHADAEDDEDTADEEPELPRRTTAWLWGPALALLGLALGWNALPGLPEAAARAAAGFTDPRAYAAAVLDGVHLRPAPAPRVDGLDATSLAYAAASLLGALLLAAAGLRPVRLTRRLVRPAEAIRGLHSGHPGDYIAYTALGAAVLTGALAVGLG